MKKTAREHAQILEERWPLLFNFNEPKPLKIKVAEDIYAQINESEWLQIRKALATYAGRLVYSKCLAKGGDRYDLDGGVSGEISKEDVQRSKDRISAHAEKIKEKKKAAEKKKKFEANLKKAAKAAQEKAPETEKNTLSIKLPSTKKTDNSTVIIKKKRTVIIPEK
jgi:sRNA-binding protein